MLIDYGKRAYIKLGELEKRIVQLENQIKKTAYNTLFFDLTTPEIITKLNKSVKFLSNGDSLVKGEVFLGVPQGAFVNYQISCKGLVIKYGKTSSLENIITFDFAVEDGINSLDFTFYSSVEFEFNSIKITLGGQIDYYNQKRKLSLATTGYSDYIIYQYGDSATLYDYGLDGLVKVTEFNGVYDISLLGFSNEKLYVAVIDDKNALTIQTLDISKDTISKSSVLSKNVSSVCGYISQDRVKVIFSKTGEIMVGEYSFNQTFSFEKSGRRGDKVTADSSVIDAYVIYGDYKPTKFVEYFATYVLNKGENYHVIKDGDAYLIYYGLDGWLYKQTVNGNVSKPIKLSACDEILKLHDGKYIKRVRDVLTVENEDVQR